MDYETKRVVGVLLGELLRTQKRIDPKLVEVTDDVLFGLQNGIEDAFDEYLAHVPSIPNGRVESLVDVLDEIDQDPVKRAKVKGYYDIEKDVQKRGIERGEAITILQYLHKSNRYNALIRSFGEEDANSPHEMKGGALTR